MLTSGGGRWRGWSKGGKRYGLVLSGPTDAIHATKCSILDPAFQFSLSTTPHCHNNHFKLLLHHQSYSEQLMQSMQTKNAVPDRPHGILVSWANKRLLQTQEFAISNCKQPLLAVESQSRVWHCAAEFSLVGSVIGLPDLTCLPG